MSDRGSFKKGFSDEALAIATYLQHQGLSVSLALEVLDEAKLVAMRSPLSLQGLPDVPQGIQNPE
jgi:hypothetical protein